MSDLLCNKIVCCHSFKLFRICISPCMEILSGQGNCFSEGHKKLRNIFLKNGSDFFSHGFISLCLTAIDIKHKSRLNFAVYRFCGTTETDLSGLMCSTGGRAPGNMNLWKGSVRNFCFMDCFYAGEQKLLRVAKPDLTDGSSDTAYRGFKKRFSSVFCQFQNFFCFFPVRFTIYALSSGERRISASLMPARYSARRQKDSAEG